MEQAVELILSGNVVAFPTETVYGLGADALNEKAIRKIFQIKDRPFEDPLIVHVADADVLESITEPFDSISEQRAVKLMTKFWPGPLTIIFKKNKSIPDSVTAGRDTVAVRMPRNLIALALLKNSKRPIAAPSANRFQSLSPTTAEAVAKELGDRIPLILDGGPCQVGVESTVLSLVDGPLILRPGGVTREQIEYVLNEKIEVANGNSDRKSSEGASSPGMLDFHYAPKTPLKFMKKAELEKELKKRTFNSKIAKTSLLCFSKGHQKVFLKSGFLSTSVLSERGNLEEAARVLFIKLREIDESGAEKIIALDCPDEGLGVAINDRLKKAEHK